MVIERALLISIEEWQQLNAEPMNGPILPQMRELYCPQLLSQRLDNLLLLQKICQKALQDSQFNGDYHPKPIHQLVEQAQALIEYILNAKDAEQADQLLREREFYRPFVPKYVTAPPYDSPMYRALLTASEFDPQKPDKIKRMRFRMLNCLEHLKALMRTARTLPFNCVRNDLQEIRRIRILNCIDKLRTTEVLQLSPEMQLEDSVNGVGRYSAVDREIYRILPASRHQGFVHLITRKTANGHRLIIEDFHTTAPDNSDSPVPFLLVLTPAGDYFAIREYRDQQNDHATSSLHYGAMILFAGRFQAQGRITHFLPKDHHYDVTLPNTLKMCVYLKHLGLLTFNESLAIIHQKLQKDKYGMPLLPAQQHIEEQLRSLYGIEATRRSHFTQQPAYLLKANLPIGRTFNESALNNRAMEFVNQQQERFQQILPPSLLHKRIGLARHLQHLRQIQQDPFITNKENAITVYEHDTQAQLFSWACQETIKELNSLKLLLLSIMQSLIQQNAEAIKILQQFLDKIAEASMTLSNNTPSVTDETKQQQITAFTTYRNQLFKQVHALPLKPEQRSQLEQHSYF